MILVLFFLSLIFLVALFTTKIRLEFKKFRVSNNDESGLIKEFNLDIKLYIFKFIKIFQKNINKDDLKKIGKSNKIKKIVKNYKNNNNRELKTGYTTVKNLKTDFKSLDLNIEIGTEDVILTSFAVCTVSTIIFIFLGRVIKKYDSKKYKYIITPIYNEKNSIKLTLLGIVDFKLVNIINIIFKLLIRSGRNDKRASYRKLNVNSNEQYPANDRC